MSRAKPSSPDRELRDHLEEVEARERATREELQSALRAAYGLQRQLATALARVSELETSVTRLEERAAESAEVRDLLAASMTTKFSPVPNAAAATGFASTVAVVALLVFLFELWRTMR